MNRLVTLSLILAAAAVPASAAVSVETATGDWSNLPKLSQRGYQHLNEKMEAKLFEIAQSGQCPTFGLKQGRLDFSVTFATQYGSDGALQRLVLPKLDCAEAASVVGGALLEMLQAGDYAPTGKSPAGWYQGGLEFTFSGDAARSPAVPQPTQEAAAAKMADENQIVCHKIEEIGSRLSTKRICMSKAQWADQERTNKDEVNRIQTQRNCGPLGLDC
jgi:hypothetical protein